jgi:uncharacterized protein (TIGR03492 family)
VVIPGAGPQFTRLFADRQCDLLGESVILAANPQAVGLAVSSLVGKIDQLSNIAANGRLRMGDAGAARRIASKLVELSQNDD